MVASDSQSHINVMPPGLAALVARAARSGRGAPPVERWNPPDCGAIDIGIDAEGGWTYGGSPIAREPLVRLFASVLRRDADGSFYLVTPVEKLRISVADAPFMAVELFASGAGRARRLTFRTNVGDVVEAGPEHPLRFEVADPRGDLRPYVLVRGRLEARLARPLLYELVELGEERDGRFGIEAGGAFFAIDAPVGAAAAPGGAP